MKNLLLIHENTKIKANGHDRYSCVSLVMETCSETCVTRCHEHGISMLANTYRAVTSKSVMWSVGTTKRHGKLLPTVMSHRYIVNFLK